MSANQEERVSPKTYKRAEYILGKICNSKPILRAFRIQLIGRDNYQIEESEEAFFSVLSPVPIPKETQKEVGMVIGLILLTHSCWLALAELDREKAISDPKRDYSLVEAEANLELHRQTFLEAFKGKMADAYPQIPAEVMSQLLDAAIVYFASKIPSQVEAWRQEQS